MENNNLSELNNLLFETLKGVKSGSIDVKRAQTVTGVANSIISNTKLQLEAFKITKGKAFASEFSSTRKPIEVTESPTPKLPAKDVYNQKNDFAIYSGYKNVTDAMDNLGGAAAFDVAFNKWLKN